MPTLDLFTGFEHGSAQWLDATSGTGTTAVTAGSKRNGNFGLDMTAGGHYIATKLLPVSCSEFYFRTGLKIIGFPAGAAPVGLYFQEGATIHTQVGGIAGGLWTIRNPQVGGLQLTGGAVTAGQYYCVEGHVLIADAGGILTLKIDGTIILNSVGDTRNGGTGLIDRLVLDCPNNTVHAHFDDIAFSRDGWIGNGMVIDKAPNGIGDSAQFAIAGGDPTNWEAVARRPPDPAHYVYDTVVDHFDLHTLAASGLTAGAVINAVQPYAFGMLNQPGAGNLAVGIKGGGVEDWSADIALPSDSWKFVNEVHSVRPVGMGGGAWTQATVDALQAGYKVR